MIVYPVQDAIQFRFTIRILGADKLVANAMVKKQRSSTMEVVVQVSIQSNVMMGYGSVITVDADLDVDKRVGILAIEQFTILLAPNLNKP